MPLYWCQVTNFAGIYIIVNIPILNLQHLKIPTLELQYPSHVTQCMHVYMCSKCWNFNTQYCFSTCGCRCWNSMSSAVFLYMCVQLMLKFQCPMLYFCMCSGCWNFNALQCRASHIHTRDTMCIGCCIHTCVWIGCWNFNAQCCARVCSRFWSGCQCLFLYMCEHWMLKLQCPILCFRTCVCIGCWNFNAQCCVIQHVCAANVEISMPNTMCAACSCNLLFNHAT